MVPNPTKDHWLKKTGSKPSWTMTRMMEVFQTKLNELSDAREFGSNPQFIAIVKHWERIQKLDCTDEANLSLQCREAIHDALDERTDFLLSMTQVEVLSVLVAHITRVVDVLSDPGSFLNTIVLAHKEEHLLAYYFKHIRPLVCDVDMNNDAFAEAEKEKRHIIWVSLLFRMLCWYLLHDFDKADVKIVPSDLKGSRMPVFIG
jgi:hypothetical protein